MAFDAFPSMYNRYMRNPHVAAWLLSPTLPDYRLYPPNLNTALRLSIFDLHHKFPSSQPSFPYSNDLLFLDHTHQHFVLGQIWGDLSSHSHPYASIPTLPTHTAWHQAVVRSRKFASDTSIPDTLEIVEHVFFQDSRSILIFSITTCIDSKLVRHCAEINYYPPSSTPYSTPSSTLSSTLSSTPSSTPSPSQSYVVLPDCPQLVFRLSRQDACQDCTFRPCRCRNSPYNSNSYTNLPIPIPSSTNPNISLLPNPALTWKHAVNFFYAGRRRGYLTVHQHSPSINTTVPCIRTHYKLYLQSRNALLYHIQMNLRFAMSPVSSMPLATISLPNSSSPASALSPPASLQQPHTSISVNASPSTPFMLCLSCKAQNCSCYADQVMSNALMNFTLKSTAEQHHKQQQQYKDECDEQHHPNNHRVQEQLENEKQQLYQNFTHRTHSSTHQPQYQQSHVQESSEQHQHPEFAHTQTVHTNSETHHPETKPYQQSSPSLPLQPTLALVISDPLFKRQRIDFNQTDSINFSVQNAPCSPPGDSELPNVLKTMYTSVSDQRGIVMPLKAWSPFTGVSSPDKTPSPHMSPMLERTASSKHSQRYPEQILSESCSPDNVEHNQQQNALNLIGYNTSAAVAPSVGVQNRSFCTADKTYSLLTTPSISRTEAIPDAEYVESGAVDTTSFADATESIQSRIGHLSKNRSRSDVQCEMCGDVFAKRGNKLRHIQTVHYGVKQFHCDICGSRFGSKRDLDRHKFRKHESRCFSCMKCGKRFAQREQLKEHERLAHEEDNRPWQCPECCIRLGRKSSLTRHVQTVHQKVRFACRSCPKSYSQRFDRVRHERRCHGFSDDAEDEEAR